MNQHKNRVQTNQNPPRFGLAAPNWCQIDAGGSQNRFLGDFGVYFGAQNEAKITKILQKSEEIFEDVFGCKFIEIFIGFRAQNALKISTFSALFENTDFAKNIVFPQQKHYFSGSELPKIAPKSSSKHVRKKHCQKIEFRVDFRSILGGFGAPKWLKMTSTIDVKKSIENRCQNELPGPR